MDNSIGYKPPGTAQIKVVGVGGGGNNAVNRMVTANIQSANFIAINTDGMALHGCKAPTRIQIGGSLTKGLGAGAKPQVGEQAAIESKNEIIKQLEGTDLVFITAGMGGGTGTGAAPVVAKIAKEMGILTIGVVTKPFHFEGTERMHNAEVGIANLKNAVDSLVVVPNQKLLEVAQGAPILEMFKIADDVLRHAVQGLSDLIVMPSLINLDFADVRTIMKGKGRAHMGIGSAGGENRAVKAMLAAANSPLLETKISDATGIIIGVSGGVDIGGNEIEEAVNSIRSMTHPNANIIWGLSIVPELQDRVVVTLIATGFDSKESLHSYSFHHQTPNTQVAQNIQPPQQSTFTQQQQVKSPPPARTQAEILNDFIKPGQQSASRPTSAAPNSPEKNKPQINVNSNVPPIVQKIRDENSRK